MIYSVLQLISWYSTNLFFRDITVINEQNIPQDGPTIIYGNHNNQFVDGMLMMSKVKRQIHFIAAAKSCERTFLGPLIRGTGAIPVERAQDRAKAGPGKIVQLKNGIIRGVNTKFTARSKGETLEIKGVPQINVAQIISDQQIRTDTPADNFQGEHAYKVIPKLDYNQVYERVWQSLKENKCIGIYPQGGSHDRIELLPLKAGICIMALGAMAKYGISVKLVPCGFNYYNPQNFRSKALLEFGPAYEIPVQMVELFKTSKRRAIAILLQNVEKMLKAVTIQFKEYNQLNALYLCRSLYTSASNRPISPREMLQLNRRFAKGYSKITQDPEYSQMKQQVLRFSQYVKLTGLPITKEAVFGSRFIDFIKFVFYFNRCVLMSAIALPGLAMFGPTTTLIAYLSQKERQKCLKGSKVKMYGHDVVGSYKILLGSFLLPLTCAAHSTILFFLLKKFTKITQDKIIKICLGVFALQPIYALLLVKSYDELVTSFKKLKYLFFNLFGSNVYAEFNEKKKKLQKTVIALVQKMGCEVVENFNDNRVLKREEIAASGSQLYIFDEDKESAQDILRRQPYK